MAKAELIDEAGHGVPASEPIDILVGITGVVDIERMTAAAAANRGSAGAAIAIDLQNRGVIGSGRALAHIGSDVHQPFYAGADHWSQGLRDYQFRSRCAGTWSRREPGSACACVGMRACHAGVCAEPL